jgi:hypothetical protein
MPLTDGMEMAQHLTNEWHQALAGDQSAQAQWQVVEGDKWIWQDQGLSVTDSGAEWSSLEWRSCGPSTMKVLKNFVIGVTLRGKAEAAGLSFGPGKDFVADLDPLAGARCLQLEVDAEADCWVFRVDGRLVEQNPILCSGKDLLGGQFSLKVKQGEVVLFQDLTVHAFEASCQLSVFVPCYRFLQRLRISLHSWCEQNLPTGAYEILVGNPESPDGTHEHLAAVAGAYPHVRVREAAFPFNPRVNVSAMYNHLVDICKGRWILITDADCLYSPTFVATIMEQIRGQDHLLFLGRRLFLTQSQTNGLLSGRIDGVTQFEKLASSATLEPPFGKMPWSASRFGQVREQTQRLTGGLPSSVATGLQIVHRSVLEQVPYREIYHGEDIVFIVDCKRHGISPIALDDFVCLHMEHPFAWHTTDAFL